jgi:hypothetical protein
MPHAIWSTGPDVSAYHGRLLDQFRHVEDTINKFAIQNYASCGAVILSYLTTERVPLWIATTLVVLISACFTTAIWFQLERARPLFFIQRTVRDHLFDPESGLGLKLRQDTNCRKYLAAEKIEPWVFAVILCAALVPVIGVGLLWFR